MGKPELVVDVDLDEHFTDNETNETSSFKQDECLVIIEGLSLEGAMKGLSQTTQQQAYVHGLPGGAVLGQSDNLRRQERSGWRLSRRSGGDYLHPCVSFVTWHECHPSHHL